MPIINGQKMACEPCIRGHRSTKCNHANERLMVPVRKPGRPLSLCPHPPSRQCGCAGVTAAIPRKQTCGCGTSKSKASKNGVAAQADSPATNDTDPASPTRPGNGSTSFRVQKSSKTPSRKASIDPTNLERMDAGQVNILPAFDARQQAQTPSNAAHPMPTPPVSGYSPMPISPHHVGPIDAMMMPFYPQQAASPALGHAMQHPASSHPANGTSQPSSSGHNTQVASGPPTNHASGGCCSGSNSEVVAPEPKKGSCCGSKTPPTNAESIGNGGHGATPHAQQPSPVMMAPSMTPSHQPYPPYFPHPTIFHYPPNYGSYLQPLLPELWKQAMTSMMAQTLGSPTAIGAPNMGFMPSGTPTTPSLGSSHVCTCGDGCQCVGCAAHPYNDATQDYVRSAWNTMREETWANGMGSPLQGPAQFHARNQHMPSLNGVQLANGPPSVASAPIPNDDSAATTKPAVSEPTRTCCGAEPSGAEPEAAATTSAPPAVSPAPQTPSDAASGTSEEQTLSASDFFFVTYPFEEPCLGDTASCPCGDDCQCLGCVVHGNSIEAPGEPEGV